MFRIGVDTGGTNTDLVLVNKNTGEIYSTKTATTTHNLIDGIFNGLEKISQMAKIDYHQIREFIYGTTIVVNMIAQKENENVALITTKGFRDIIEIGRAWRDKNIYDNFMTKNKPLVRRDLRFEISERMDFSGEVIEPLNESDVREIARRLREQKIRSVAVCLLHSYRNNYHENRIKEILLEELPDIYISISSEINPQFREYERTSTTVINAYMMPNMVSHLQDLNMEFNKHNLTPVKYMMNSNAGIMSFESAIKKPVMVSDSGPIGGIIAANLLGSAIGERNLITFDMGGTSCDVSLIREGEINFRTDSDIEGYPINIPTVDLNFIGAGGGSIAWCDRGGALKVGPRSAGAFPGPVCYERGGTEPTVTDANIILGRIRPEIFLENVGTVIERTKSILFEKIASPLNLSINEAAEGIIQIVNANMQRAVKKVSVQKGYNPSDFTLVSFGGAGGLHAGKLAEELNIPKVIIPISPGTFAALGQTLADIKHDFVYTYLQRADQIKLEELNQIFLNLEVKGIKQLQDEGIPDESQLLIRSCDIRYQGQAFELNINTASGVITEGEYNDLIKQFHLKHEEIYGHALRDDNVELVNYRVSAVGLIDKTLLKKKWVQTNNKKLEINYGRVIFDGKEYDIPIFHRNQLKPGFRINEPAIIGEMGATTVIYPGHEAVIDDSLSIIINTNVNKQIGRFDFECKALY